MLIPWITGDGDIVMATREKKNYPALLSVREKEGGYEAKVVRHDSAEGMGVRSLYGMTL